MTEIESLEAQKESLKVRVEMKGLVEKLMSNREFKKVVLDEFCTKEAARYVQASVNPILSPTQQADALGIAQATGHFRSWLQTQINLGNQAIKEIRDTDAEIEDLRAEEASDEQGAE